MIEIIKWGMLGNFLCLTEDQMHVLDEQGFIRHTSVSYYHGGNSPTRVSDDWERKFSRTGRITVTSYMGNRSGHAYGIKTNKEAQRVLFALRAAGIHVIEHERIKL